MTAEKVQIVEENAQTYGLNVTLDAIGLPKSTWYYWKNQKVDYEEKYAHLRQPLIEVLRELSVWLPKDCPRTQGSWPPSW